MTEIKIALQPKQKQFRESIEQFQVSGYGGAKGGGKSHGIRNIMLLRRFQYPGSIGRIFRRTFPELEDNHIRPLMTQFPSLVPYYHESKKILSLPNGSTLHFNHCQNEKDVFLYQGRETHDLGIDQAEQWTHQMYSILRGSNRSSVPGIKPKTLLTFNPGDIGHGWLKRLFITRRFHPNEIPGDHNFIQALVDDNPALMDNDPEYVQRLDAEPNEALRKAYRYGDWDIFAGQFFTEIRRDKHLVKPFDIPKHWNRFGAYDFGFNHPASFGWYAVSEDGDVFKYRELVQAGLRVDQMAQKINEFQDTAKLEYIVAGWDCWVQKGVIKSTGAPTVAEEFLNHGLTLKRAIIDRQQGAAQVRSYLAWQGRPNEEPRFKVFETCPITFDTLSRMIHDPDRVEDVLKVDATQGDPLSGDDAYDETRYGLMSRPMISDAEILIPNLRDPKQYIAHTQKLMEDNLQKQVDRQVAEEQGNDFDEIMLTMEPEEDPLKYYLNKKRAR